MDATKTRTLLEDVSYVQLSLVERKDPKDTLRVRGEFARCGQATENKRVYSEALWGREFSRLEKALAERRLFGELDHPADGRTQLSRVSHIITGLHMEDGKVVGEAEIFPTATGQVLMSLLKAGCKVGVSSRGYGSVKPNAKGEDVVQEDYKLVTFDFVAEPADTTAYPEIFGESKKALFEGVVIDVNDEEEKLLAKRWTDKLGLTTNAAADDSRATLKEEFARDILGHIGKLKAEVTEQVRGEMLSDPTVAGSKAALEAVKDILRPFILPEDAEGVLKVKEQEAQRLRNQISERDLKIKGLEEENQKLAGLAREAGFRYFLEKTLSSDPDADSIRTLIGDVTQYLTSADLKKKVEDVKTEISSQRALAEAAQAEKDAEIAALQAEQDAIQKAALAEQQAIQAHQARMEETLVKAMESNKALALQLYAEKRISKLGVKGQAVRKLMESSGPSSKEEVDALFETALREPVKDTEELAATRARIREQTRGGTEGDPLTEEHGQRSARSPKNYNGTGLDLEALKSLAGI